MTWAHETGARDGRMEWAHGMGARNGRTNCAYMGTTMTIVTSWIGLVGVLGICPWCCGEGFYELWMAMAIHKLANNKKARAIKSHPRMFNRSQHCAEGVGQVMAPTQQMFPRADVP